MSLAPRETIYAALLTQLQTAGTIFQTYTRRWKSVWDDPGSQVAALPMLIQQDQNERIRWDNRGIGGVSTWSVKLEVYAKIPDGTTPGVPDGTTPGSAVLNPLIDALFEALAPSGPDGLQTLGDLVIDCRIEGEIIRVLGDEDPSGLCGAIVPVIIQVISSR